MNGGGLVGRFAPSPTGRLHLGSLLAAMGSYCDVRSRGGRWLVRMEDLDPPREVPGAAEDILRTLEGFGFEWDGPVLLQSERHRRYQEVLDLLQTEGAVYPCGCSRKDWQGHAHYPGTCRTGLPAGRNARLNRFALSGKRREWTDRYRGGTAYDTADLGDFPVLRADGHWAYQLAVVVDDRDQGVNTIIRGADLLDSTPLQLDLWAVLDHAEEVCPRPEFGHLPILQTGGGQKLSKQTLARPVEVEDAASLLDQVWRLLGQSVSPEWLDRVKAGDGRALLNLAAEIWDPLSVPTAPVQLHGWGQDERPGEDASKSTGRVS